MLIARAGHDIAHFNESIDRFVTLVLEKNISLDLMTHPTGQHGFDTLDDDERSRQIIRGTLSFLQEHPLWRVGFSTLWTFLRACLAGH